MAFTIRARIGAVYRVPVQLTESLEVLDHLVRPCDLHRCRQRLVVDPCVVEKTGSDSMVTLCALGGQDDTKGHSRKVHRREERAEPASDPSQVVVMSQTARLADTAQIVAEFGMSKSRISEWHNDWAEANNVEFAYTPTNSSWLNRFEAPGGMIRHYIIWRNGHTADKRLRTVINRASVA